MSRKFNIKSLVPRKHGAFQQGYYTLMNPQKYIGDPTKIIFRSSWEKKFCVFCDLNEKVLSWSSETIQVPYLHPIDAVTKIYNVDFFMKIRKDDGTETNYIVEVKPSKKLVKPKAPEVRITEKKMNGHLVQMKEYLINMHKFKAAQEWAKARGWQFILVTEKFLF